MNLETIFAWICGLALGFVVFLLVTLGACAVLLVYCVWILIKDFINIFLNY